MQSRSGNEIRELFLRFFESKGHRRVHSSSLVPANDPTLLFANAGMNQFKDLFLGAEKREDTRATTSQKCVRAGGEHNDLENVGFPPPHHTFFEMLGNFSFGDYFKRDAIQFAWELVTSEEWFGIPKDRLYVTIFEGADGVPRDDEAEGYWIEAGVPKERIFEYGLKDNFWQMGETGACGPCSEIFYDMGMEAAETPGVDLPFGQDDARYVEIWNLVFMQFDRSADGTLTPLPKPSIDTGAGLERLAAVMQGVHSNYDIDLFRELITAAAEATGATDRASPSLRVIADHIRACSFLIVDGVLPSNEGRGYVLRRIIRRAVRHGYQLGQAQPFFYKIVPALVASMGEAFPELARAAEQVARVLRQEEERLAETLSAGMLQFEARMREHGGDTVPGTLVFLLHDTYGFPPDLTADIARERSLNVDTAGYEREMQAQRERARAASRFGVEQRGGVQVAERSEFCGYEAIECEGRVVALLRNGVSVEALTAGESGEVILDRTV